MLGAKHDKACPKCGKADLRVYASLGAALKGMVTESLNPIYLLRTIFGEVMKVTTDIVRLENQYFCESCEAYSTFCRDCSRGWDFRYPLKHWTFVNCPHCGKRHVYRID